LTIVATRGCLARQIHIAHHYTLQTTFGSLVIRVEFEHRAEKIVGVIISRSEQLIARQGVLTIEQQHSNHLLLLGDYRCRRWHWSGGGHRCRFFLISIKWGLASTETKYHCCAQ